MIASKVLGALVVAAVCSSALSAGIYRAETKGHELAEQSSFASPAQVGARKSAESTQRLEQASPKIEQQQTRPLERLEQVKQEPAATQLKEEYPQLEQSALKQEEYREESIKSAAPAPAAAPAPVAAPAPLAPAAPAAAPLAAPIKGGERKSESKYISPAKTQQTHVRFEQSEQRREEPQREEQKQEFKQEKLENYEQKKYQQQEYDSEPAYVAASRYEEQQPIAQQQVAYSEEQTRLDSSSSIYQAPVEAKGRKAAPKPLFAAGLEQVRQEEELSSASLQQQQQPAGEPEPYQFSYQVDGSSRSEQGDTKGVVRGQYTLQGADGANRVVDYVADHNGFRATVNTNEFGTESKSPANVQLRTSQPLAEEIAVRTDSSRVASLRPLRLEATKGAARYEAPAKGYYQQQEQVKEVKYEAPKYEAPKEVRYEAPAKGYYQQQEQVKEVRYEAPAKGYSQQQEPARYEAIKETRYEAPKETRYEAPAKGYLAQQAEQVKETRYEAPKETRYEAPAKGYLPQQPELAKETRYEAPAKGYLAQQQSELPKDAQWSTKSHSAQSAEYRAPEPQNQEPLRATEDSFEQPQQQQSPRYAPKQPQATRAFESATAHQYERKLSPAASRTRVATRPAVLQ